jgi:hypothetical protein
MERLNGLGSRNPVPAQNAGGHYKTHDAQGGVVL